MKKIFSMAILLGFLSVMYITAQAEQDINKSSGIIEYSILPPSMHKNKSIDTVRMYGGVAEILNGCDYEYPEVVEIEPVYTISDNEREELARLIMCEAGGEDLDGKVLVGNVVMNRIKSNEFPDDVVSVIRQNRGDVYQFSPVGSGKIDRVEPSEECYEAIDKVLEGYDISEGALYFESCSGESWHSRNLEFIFKHGGHRFYK